MVFSFAKAIAAHLIFYLREASLLLETSNRKLMPHGFLTKINLSNRC